MSNTTHEQFIQAVRDIAIGLALKLKTIDAAQASTLANVKMVYGRGTHGLRGLTQFNAWKHTDAHCASSGCTTGSDLVEICALGEESWVQLAGTTIHELAHVLAGGLAGHSKEWKQAAHKLGLRRVHAAGTNYLLANFSSELRMHLAVIAKPDDGAPRNLVELFKLAGKQPPKQRVCSAGIGTRGGKARGIGSGSRLRKYVCTHGQIVRASTDELDAVCQVCNTKFILQ